MIIYILEEEAWLQGWIADDESEEGSEEEQGEEMGGHDKDMMLQIYPAV